MHRLISASSLEQSAQYPKEKAMGKIKLKILQIIGIVHKVVKESNSIRTFIGRVRLIIRLRLELKYVTRTKLDAIKNHNFEFAAHMLDKEKDLLKQLNKLL